MLPLQQSYEVKQSILSYIRSSFRFKDEAVGKAFYNFIEDDKEGIIKGPYISLKTPFVAADPKATIPLEIKPGFNPHIHQLMAFERLNTEGGHEPLPTLLTTGTGSGKTECFLFPILDYCYKHIGEKGIKVVIMYPMNALATDQAKRLAEIIYNDERLRGKVTAGLFIGKGKQHAVYKAEMTEDGLIEDRDTIIEDAPDILLTNFKMLDYGLMKAENYNLWRYNIADPSLLKFLVLDELHPYDGAQGTDVANLIRRLKMKLGIHPGQICPIGTSATIGNGEDSKASLCKYASDVFGENITEDAIIEEYRQKPEDIFTGDADNYLPKLKALDKLRMTEEENYDDYIARQIKLWQLFSEDTVSLSEELCGIQILRDIIAITSNEGIISKDELVEQLKGINTQYADLPETFNGISPRDEILGSLLALISEAKRQNGPKRTPFLTLQVQLWVKELSGIRRVFCKEPKFTWKMDKVKGDEAIHAYPAYYCTECGASGWLIQRKERNCSFEKKGEPVGKAFMENDKKICYVNTFEESHKCCSDYGLHNADDHLYVDPETMKYFSDPVDGGVEVYCYNKMTRNNQAAEILNKDCPECNENGESMMIIGGGNTIFASLSIAQVLSSNLENSEGRKILAFTNGVQDAAHNASFFEARNYRFMFRTAIQRVVKEISEPISLSELEDRFVEFWKHEMRADEKNDPMEDYVYRFFPADYENYVQIHNNFRDSNDRFTNSFIQEFDTRMKWEVAHEYGLNATVGRTLEKTSSSATFFKKEDLQAVFEDFKPWLIENEREDILSDEKKFLQFVNSLLHRIRTRCGIDHEYLSMYRDKQNGYLLNWGGRFNHTFHHFLNPQYGPKMRWPKVLITNERQARASNTCDSTFMSGHNMNWYHRYYSRVFENSELALHLQGNVNDFYEHLFESIAHAGLMTIVDGTDGKNYMINPDKLYISKNVDVHMCSTCHGISCVAKEDELMEDSLCIKHRCTGVMDEYDNSDYSYYRLVYSRNIVPRVYAHEHTGMLERKKRESIENDFINQPNSDSINTLVATSTLEMGIDIGDLNCTMNISVPPEPANYLQRIGRAGRKSGSALILNFIKKSKPHDLFYFEDPMEMMKGDVGTPGCFLMAKDILRRHFYAFCIDSWSKDDPEQNSIPSTIKEIRPGSNFYLSDEFFTTRIASFIKNNISELKDCFTEQYNEDVRTEVLPKIFKSIEDGSFFSRVNMAFTKITKEYLHILGEISAIKDIIKTKHLAKNDEEYIELKEAEKALARQRNDIKRRNVLEYMTDNGLLPNYAFPETGVTLKATVRSSTPKGDNGTSVPIDETFELVRSAEQAYKELAPNNNFYTQKYMLKVDGIDTSDWNDSSVLKQYRFCSCCDYMEPVSASNPSSCPKCGDKSFGSDSNKHNFLLFHSVKSFMNRDKAADDDSSEERLQKSYKTTSHFNFMTDGSTIAYGMKDIPFGIEYVKKVEFTEVNYGESEEMSSENITVNGRPDLPVHGYVTCKHCGKSTPNPGRILCIPDQAKRLKQWHYPYCKYKNQEYNMVEDDCFKHVYLTRKIDTEAIKILLPVEEIDSLEMLAMFKAGLELGMKDYFKGNPGHIKMQDYKEKNMATGRVNNYVILYDAIPGGTGYLAKLFKTEEFTKLLKLSLERIKTCKCQNEGKDGCYHCILTYGNQFDHEKLSRKKAEALFQKIVDRSDKWETIAGSVSSIAANGTIEESELEEWFIRIIEHHAEETDGWNFKKIEESDGYYYTLSIETKEQKRGFTIQPQIWLDASYGLTNFTRSDFLITCTECIDKIHPENEIETLALPKIAIYLDGYQYHGCNINGKIRFFDDLKIRAGINKSDSPIISWSLSWDDLKLFENNDGDSLRPQHIEHPAKSMTESTYQRTAPIYDVKDNLSRLFYVMMNIIEKTSLHNEISQFLISKNHNLKIEMHSTKEMQNFLDTSSGDYTWSLKPTPNDLLFTCCAAQNTSWCRTNICIIAGDRNNGPDARFTIYIHPSEKDLNLEEWKHFLRLYNLLGLLKLPDE